jgi:hypothetical protein
LQSSDVTPAVYRMFVEDILIDIQRVTDIDYIRAVYGDYDEGLRKYLAKLEELNARISTTGASNVVVLLDPIGDGGGGGAHDESRIP